MRKEVIEFNKSQQIKKMPEFKTGDIVRVHRKIIESGKERIQIFEGMIIAIKGKQSSSPTITVRKVSSGVGVELIIPIFSPKIGKIEIIKRAKIRRSKAYHIRNKSVKSLRMKYKEFKKVTNAKNLEKNVENSTQSLEIETIKNKEEK